jgi:hypothetical protein
VEQTCFFIPPKEQAGISNGYAKVILNEESITYKMPAEVGSGGCNKFVAKVGH